MRHVLIVDDALDLGRLLKAALSLIDSTMPIVVVPSGEEALLEGTRYPLDLLVTDIRLPGISGVELVQKIRKHHPDVKIIVITGMSDGEIFREVKALGVDYFFTKPLIMADFTEAAQRCLNMTPPADASQGGVTKAGEEVSLRQIADVLSELRGRLNVSAVTLLDERARIAAQAGDMPESFLKDEILTGLKTAAGAITSVADLLGKPKSENMLACRGEAFDLVLAPVGHFAVVILLESGSTNLRFALCFEEVTKAQNELAQIIEKLGLGTTPAPNPFEIAPQLLPVEESLGAAGQPEAEEQLQEFEALFQKTVQVEQEAVKEFWDMASEQAVELEAEDPDVLTYDQARQLGLAPEQNE